MSGDFPMYLQERRERVNAYLMGYVDRRCSPEFAFLKDAIGYSLLSGGKRLRPIIVLASCSALGGNEDAALPFGCAIEMIHTFSLIHDDLPSMDDDDLRRNRPTNHKVFGEAHAILAGDALLAEAFRLMAEASGVAGVDASTALRILSEVADAAGIAGMVGGQSLDLLAENKSFDDEVLRTIHRCKTARFIASAAVTGGLVAHAGDAEIDILRRFGENIGLAFQIQDDVLNETGSSGKTGKSVGSDARHGKATYPALHGLAESRRMAEEYSVRSIDALGGLGERAQRLREIARFIVTREQ